MHVRLTSTFDPRVSHHLICAWCRRVTLLSLVLWFISISSRSSNFSQVSATGIGPRPSLHSLHPIHPSIPTALPPSAVKVKSNWIVPSPVFPLGLSVCVCVFARVCVCYGICIHIWIKTASCMSAFIHDCTWVWNFVCRCVCKRELNIFCSLLCGRLRVHVCIVC